MALERMDNVLIVVDDLDAVIAFFVELGMELPGQGAPRGTGRSASSGSTTSNRTSRCCRSQAATAASSWRNSTGPRPCPPSRKTRRRTRRACAASCSPSTTSRTSSPACAATAGELVGELVQHEDSYRLRYIRGPEGLIVALAEQLG